MPFYFKFFFLNPIKIIQQPIPIAALIDPACHFIIPEKKNPKKKNKGKHWLESNAMAVMQANSPAASGGNSTGSALLDTYLQLIAEHSSNMAAAAAAAAAASSTATNNNNSEANNGTHDARDAPHHHHQESLLDATFTSGKRSPKTTTTAD